MYLNWTQWAMGGFKVEVFQLDSMRGFKVELFVFSIGLTHASAEKPASPAPTPSALPSAAVRRAASRAESGTAISGRDKVFVSEKASVPEAGGA